MNRSRLLSSTLTVSILRLVGQSVALISGVLISNYFGATSATDNYYAALILPPALANLVINILTNLFSPLYLERIQEHPNEQKPILASLTFIVTLWLLIGIIISVIAVPVSIELRNLDSPAAVQQAYVFGLWLVLLTPLVGYIRLLGIIADTHQHYGTSAVTYLANPIAFVITLVLLREHLDIYSLLVANLVGHVLELLFLFIQVTFRLRILPRPRPSIHPVVREILAKSLVPSLMFVAVFLIPTFDRLIASMLDEGSLTAFHYGDRIVTAIDLMVVANSIGIIYYYWADITAKKGLESVIYSLNDVITLLWFIVFPLGIGGLLLSYPLISILFERGAFTNVAESALTFGILMVSLVFYYMIVLASWLLRLTKDVKRQAAIAVGLSILSLALNLILTPFFGLVGIVLSTLLARLIMMLIGYWLVHNQFVGVSIRPALPRIGRTLICASLMAVAVVLLQGPFGPALTRQYGLVSQIGAFALLVLAGGSVYVLCAFLIRHPDMISLLDMIAGTRYGGLLLGAFRRTK